MKIQVEDLNSRKRGILYMVTGKKRNGEAVGILTPPPYLQGGSLLLSDIQFAWAIHPGTGGDFIKNGLNVIPNPARSYGLHQPVVSVYYEIYDGDSSDVRSHVYILEHSVLDPQARSVLMEKDTVAVQTAHWGRVFRFQARKLPTGQYTVRSRVREFGSKREAVAERPFSLIWGQDSWARSEEDVLDEARVLFEEEEFRRFRSMSLADRELYLEEFWARYDEDPFHEGNALREEFYRRVAYANREFSAFGRKGMITDRGRIYIRFGPPDEITTELIPTVDNQLDNLAPILEAEDNSPGRSLGTADAVDTRPYEIWEYTQQGRPLFPEREFATSVTGLRFVFVDETGTGHWVLRYASDNINY